MNKKQKLQISWPTGKFTIADLQNQHPRARNITLRFRVNRALAAKEVVKVGQSSGSIGRPALYFARAEDPVVQQAGRDTQPTPRCKL